MASRRFVGEEAAVFRILKIEQLIKISQPRVNLADLVALGKGSNY